jgi:hypothetical protein
MIIDITCPNCNFSKKVPHDKIPEGIKFAKCPRCRNTFEMPHLDDSSMAPQKNGEMNHNNDIMIGSDPISSDEPGYFQGLWKTFTGILFSPTVFFRGIRNKGGLRESFAFGILTGSIGTMFGLFWQFLLKPEDMLFISGLFPESVSNNHIFLGLIILTPLLVMISVFIVAGVLHFFLLILRGANNGFEGTLKVGLYSNATSIFYLIPYIGEFNIGEIIAIIWSLIILVIGLREVHDTTTPRALFSLFLPFFVMIILLIVVVVVYFASSIIFGRGI